MIRRTIKIQLVIFAIITVAGVVYTGLNYVGLGKLIGGSPTKVIVKLAESGGIYPNGQVTYRGVEVGKIDHLQLTRNGVEAVLDIDNGIKIPKTGVRAVVADLSAVGEQYVDLQPAHDGPPYLTSGDVIPQARTTTPVSTAQILLTAYQLFGSVNRDHLKTVIDELGTAFADTGPDLSRIIQANDDLSKTLIDALPQTEQLITQGKTVLDTQRVVSGDLQSFARDLADLSDTIRNTDPAIRTTFDSGVVAAQQLQALFAEIQGPLPNLLGNLITAAQIQAVPVRLDGLRTMFTVYPINVFNGATVTPGDGTAHFGLVLNNTNNLCRDPKATNPDAPGYVQPGQPGFRRLNPDGSQPGDYGGASKLNVFCNPDGGAYGPDSSSITPRGSRNAPRPAGDNYGPVPGAPVYLPDQSGRTGAGAWPDTEARQYPGASSSSSAAATSPSATGVATYDPTTGVALIPGAGTSFIVGGTGGQQAVMGANSWQWMLVAPTTG